MCLLPSPHARHAGMKLANLSKILKCAGNDDAITMKSEDNGDTITFMFESPSEHALALQASLLFCGLLPAAGLAWGAIAAGCHGMTVCSGHVMGFAGASAHMQFEHMSPFVSAHAMATCCILLGMPCASHWCTSIAMTCRRPGAAVRV